MNLAQLAWFLAAASALVAAVVFFWQQRRIERMRELMIGAQRRLALLGQIAPPLSQAATESTQATCQRVVERFGALVRAETVLCFVGMDGRLHLGAKSDSGYAGFLRVGDEYQGDGIVDWACRRGVAAISGPAHAQLPEDVAMIDLSREPNGLRLGGPLVGSRDRVWAVCTPMTQHRGYGLRPAIIGAVYAERKRNDPFAPDDLRTIGVIAQLAGDALARSQFSDAVKRESEMDPLTGLLTGATFRKRLREEIEARRFELIARRDVALFFIDTDKFKLWNDTFGHGVGDSLLKSLAGVFAEVAGTGGFAGRNGGDEFCIALLDRTKDDAITVAESLRKSVERMEFSAAPGVPSPRIPITISVGVAHFPVDVSSTADAPADRLLEAADEHMYEAKRAGRNQVAYARTRALPTKIRYPGEGPIPRR